MTGSQTVTLSEAITAQPHGVVLVWSEYTSGTAQDAGWSYFFVPKQRITSGNTGGGMNCCTLHYGGSNSMAKYVYVNDTQIIGNDLNTSSANNSSFVLRYVVGI